MQKIDFDFKEFEYSLVILDTGGTHANLTHAYKAIPDEMKAVARYFDKSVLR